MQIRFLRSPDEATEAQRAVYDLLLDEEGIKTVQDIRDRLGLCSVLPVRSRLQHLADKGIIAIS